MTLEGSLDAFGVPDILRLLAATGKTGGLHLHGEAAQGVVWLADGAVAGACPDVSRQFLARRVVASGAVSDEALRAAVERAGDGTTIGVVPALLDSGALDADLVREIAREAAVDAVVDLLSRQGGSFVFVADRSNPEEAGLALPVETLLAETADRQRQRERLRDAVPATTIVLRMPVVPPDDVTLSREEWTVLALVDGRRSVGELLELGGRGSFATLRAVAALVERGLLVGDDGIPDAVAMLLRRQALLAPLEHHVPADPAVRAAASVDPPIATAVPGLAPAPLAVVAPMRRETYLPRRVPDFIEELPEPGEGRPTVDARPALLHRDPGIDRSTVLRLVAGVQGTGAPGTSG